nr:uncharacterized protein LOC123765827 [Procambarus clarkii]XP_045610570.1 uncharacterized protein LOC123765827 [Procambarus clarkii]
MPAAGRVKPLESVDPSPIPAYRGWGARVWLLTITGGVLAPLSVAAALFPLSRCSCCNSLDLWLMGLGVSALGAMLGVLAWRAKLAHGKSIDGPFILAGLLIVLNFMWLVLGNVMVSVEYTACGDDTHDGFRDSCSSSYPLLHFSLAVVVIFDVSYALLLLVVLLSCCSRRGKRMQLSVNNDYFTFPYCSCCLPGDTNRMSWQEWVGAVTAVAYLGLAVACIVVGASVVRSCHLTDHIALWLIIQGVVTVVVEVVGAWYLVCSRWTSVYWPPGSFLVFSPLVAALLLHFVINILGTVRVVEILGSQCTGEVCSEALRIFYIVVIAFYDLPFLVLLYMATIFVALMLVLLFITSCCYCCKKLKTDTESRDPRVGDKQE